MSIESGGAAPDTRGSKKKKIPHWRGIHGNRNNDRGKLGRSAGERPPRGSRWEGAVGPCWKVGKARLDLPGGGKKGAAPQARGQGFRGIQTRLSQRGRSKKEQAKGAGTGPNAGQQGENTKTTGRFFQRQPRGTDTNKGWGERRGGKFLAVRGTGVGTKSSRVFPSGPGQPAHGPHHNGAGGPPGGRGGGLKRGEFPFLLRAGKNSSAGTPRGLDSEGRRTLGGESPSRDWGKGKGEGGGRPRSLLEQGGHFSAGRPIQGAGPGGRRFERRKGARAAFVGRPTDFGAVFGKAGGGGWVQRGGTGGDGGTAWGSLHPPKFEMPALTRFRPFGPGGPWGGTGSPALWPGGKKVFPLGGPGAFARDVFSCWTEVRG